MFMGSSSETPSSTSYTGSVSSYDSTRNSGPGSRITDGNLLPTHSRRHMVDEYELGKVLGQGHFATVWLARRVTTGHLCALKVIQHQKEALPPRQAELFRREVGALAAVQHANVVALRRVVHAARLVTHATRGTAPLDAQESQGQGQGQGQGDGRAPHERKAQEEEEEEEEEVNEACSGGEYMDEDEGQDNSSALLTSSSFSSSSSPSPSSSSSSLPPGCGAEGGGGSGGGRMGAHSSHTAGQAQQQQAQQQQAQVHVSPPLPPPLLLLELELCRGGELFDYVLGGGPFPEAVARHCARELLSGVLACHAAGVHHRDLKPDNVLLGHDALTGHLTLKVADFGLAYVHDHDEDGDGDGLCRTPVGTRSYQAPEVLALSSKTGRRHGESPASAAAGVTATAGVTAAWGVGGYDGAKADAWACGVIIFILLLGSPPFQVADRSDWWFNACRLGKHGAFWKAHQRPPCAAVGAAPRALLDRLFVADPQRRASLQEVARDPWFLHSGCGPEDDARQAQAFLQAATAAAAAAQVAEKKAAMAAAAARERNHEAVFASSVIRSAGGGCGMQPPETAVWALGGLPPPPTLPPDHAFYDGDDGDEDDGDEDEEEGGLWPKDKNGLGACLGRGWEVRPRGIGRSQRLYTAEDPARLLAWVAADVAADGRTGPYLVVDRVGRSHSVLIAIDRHAQAADAAAAVQAATAAAAAAAALSVPSSSSSSSEQQQQQQHRQQEVAEADFDPLDIHPAAAAYHRHHRHSHHQPHTAPHEETGAEGCDGSEGEGGGEGEGEGEGEREGGGEGEGEGGGGTVAAWVGIEVRVWALPGRKHRGICLLEARPAAWRFGGGGGGSSGGGVEAAPLSGVHEGAEEGGFRHFAEVDAAEAAAVEVAPADPWTLAAVWRNAVLAGLAARDCPTAANAYAALGQGTTHGAATIAAAAAAAGGGSHPAASAAASAAAVPLLPPSAALLSTPLSPFSPPSEPSSTSPASSSSSSSSPASSSSSFFEAEALDVGYLDVF